MHHTELFMLSSPNMTRQQTRVVDASIEKAARRARKAEEGGDDGERRHWEEEERQLRGKTLRLSKDMRAQVEALPQGVDSFESTGYVCLHLAPVYMSDMHDPFLDMWHIRLNSKCLALTARSSGKNCKLCVLR